MIKIDEILEMLSTDNPKEIQEKGIELGKQVETLDCFIMPYYEGESEKLWENCAKIITSQPIEKEKMTNDLIQCIITSHFCKRRYYERFYKDTINQFSLVLEE